MYKLIRLFLIGILIVFTISSCKNSVIMIMDGARYSETWGDSTHKNIPYMANEMADKGLVCTRFYNDGPTYTMAGHTAITTGYYAEINNAGGELPTHPSVFQYYNKKNYSDSSLTWIIASKDKLSVLANCKDANWNYKYMPEADCGVNGLGVGSGYRSDSLTYVRINQIFAKNHPRLVLINFKEPDESGHSGDWERYLKAIKETDKYIYLVWNYLRNDKFYSNSTAVFVTNDHGRHSDGVLNGFVSHGCTCDGCRHIFFYASGPDFKSDVISTTRRDLVDIPATIAFLYKFDLVGSQGEVITELFK
jgi:hypothetical protein